MRVKAMKDVFFYRFSSLSKGSYLFFLTGGVGIGIFTNNFFAILELRLRDEKFYTILEIIGPIIAIRPPTSPSKLNRV